VTLLTQLLQLFGAHPCRSDGGVGGARDACACSRGLRYLQATEAVKDKVSY